MILFLTGNTFRDRIGVEEKSELIPNNHLFNQMRNVFELRAVRFTSATAPTTSSLTILSPRYHRDVQRRE